MSSAIPDLERVSGESVRGPRAFRWSPVLVSGLSLGAVLLLLALIGPPLVSESAETLTSNTSLGPSAEHWLGTDSFGRDRLARAIVGMQLTLLMTAGATVIAVVSGIAVGVGIWLAPRRVREISLRALEIAVSYPGLLLALVIAAILGAGAVPVVIAIGIAGIPGFARLSANLTASVSRREFVRTARLLDVPARLLLVRHILPNIAEPLLILVASSFAVSLMEISGLSFVGIGVSAPDYDLGRLLSDALPYLYTDPLAVVGPALMIVLLALSALLIGDGLAAAADPRGERLPRRFRRESHRNRATEPRTGATPDMAPGTVEVRNLRVLRADGTPLVREVSFEIAEGEILGVVGESGSGKSITAMALAQLLPDGLTVSADALRVGGIDLLQTASPGEMARAMSLVYQDPGSTFNPVMPLRTQLTDVLRTHFSLSAREAESRILQTLRAVHIVEPERVIRQRPFELSGGMKQRAMIAASLATGVRLIIADEPTTALDVTVQLEILREFRRLNREHAMSMLFISHDIAVVEALCDRIVVMREGAVVEQLTAEQLRTGAVGSAYTRRLLDSTPRLESGAS